MVGITALGGFSSGRPSQHLLGADAGGQAHPGLLELLNGAADDQALPDVLEEVLGPAVLSALVLAEVRRAPVPPAQRRVVGDGQGDPALVGGVVDDLPDVLRDRDLALVGLQVDGHLLAVTVGKC